MMRKRKIAPTFHSALRSNMMQFGTVPTLAPTIPLGGRFRTCRLLQFASLMSYLFRSLEFVDSSVLVKRVSCIYLILCFFISRRGRLRWAHALLEDSSLLCSGISYVRFAHRVSNSDQLAELVSCSLGHRKTLRVIDDSYSPMKDSQRSITSRSFHKQLKWMYASVFGSSL